MDMKKTSLQYAEQSLATMMRINAEDLPPKGRFHYHQGVFLRGMQMIYEITNDEKYFDYIKRWVDSVIDENGNVKCMQKDELDDIQAGNLLYFLYDKTNDERYMTAIKALIGLLENWKKNEKGGFWHKDRHPDQMWLDGIYMASPFMAEYARRTNNAEFYEEVEKQTDLMNTYLKDEKTGLFFHGWDCSKKVHWCDKETGRSPEKWGRAMGWYTMAMLDIMENYPPESEKRKLFAENERSIINALLKFRDSGSKVWYNIVDKGGMEGNFLEASCTCLYVYSLCKGVRMGVLDDSFKETARESYDGVMKLMREDASGDFFVSNVVIGTGIDNFAYYASVPRNENDLHGVGAFLMMCAEYYKLFGE